MLFLCAGEPCDHQTIWPALWEGEFLQKWKGGVDVIGRHFSQDDCCDIHIKEMFTGTVNDEWSILFDWTDVNSQCIVNLFWAEAWYDYEKQEIHCCVRNFRNEAGQGVYGPSPTTPYIKAPATKTLQEFAEMLETSPWDDWTKTSSTHDLNTERAASRAYKTTLRRTALAMALHQRLGGASAVACLGSDILETLV
jgi:hypothetical protein